MKDQPTVTIDGQPVAVADERNVLELCRKAGIEIPTFCYHSELSIYGACRLCLVDIDGRGIVASCSTAPAPGMRIRTNTAEIREIRKINVQLLLANHPQSCLTCAKSRTCQLLSLANKLGVDDVPFKPVARPEVKDTSSPSLVRDPAKCVLCGDCVRMCAEVQGIGALDFAYRGAKVTVGPAFGKDLAAVECVNCGQCARVCPTGAIVPKSSEKAVWDALADGDRKVVAQIAPAVRVALGEAFGMEPGRDTTARIVAALRQLGFDRVYDTSFTADLTVVEEAEEFIRRGNGAGPLPMFTSCCPAWVKFAEQYHPELLPHLSSCRSPQAMFGAVAKAALPEQLGVPRDRLTVVAIMPCTAKKYEAERPELATDGRPDVDHVLTTQELIRMIESSGIRFEQLKPTSFDMPFGFKTGAGIIFGNSGGVAEAVIRYASRRLTGRDPDPGTPTELRGEEGIRAVTVKVGDREIRVVAVHGLKNAATVARRIAAGTLACDLVEVMACPGGCVNGAGQPITFDSETCRRRTNGLYEADARLDLHNAADNPFVADLYTQRLGEAGSHTAHQLLHTAYQNRKRIAGEDITLVGAPSPEKVRVTVCVGTSCFLRGAQSILQGLMQHVRNEGFEDRVSIEATFCHEQCDRGPVVHVGDTSIEHCDAETAKAALNAAVAAGTPAAAR